MTHLLGLREVDLWFIDRVLPHEQRYLALARRFSANGEEAADLVQDVYARLMASEGWGRVPGRGVAGR
ncbi:MAG: hypothetical protein A2882_11465 [Phenylobacterium sp. RIFCSPHIGHO2_01_FULL_70_10]|nr:MAG: hypothetical protein A2882_11465 [Phenylobacterium sp. RIFCSPHIGHO2_01_FULL_70_10]